MTRGHTKALAFVLSLVVLSAILGGCGLSRPDAQLSQQPPIQQTPTADETKQAVLDRAAKVVQLLKTNDMKALADLVHPDKGLRFSPYGHVFTGENGDLIFRAADLSGLLADKTVFNWGTYDGSGDPIKLTFEKYFARFIYDVDFAAAPNVGYNEVLGIGNTLVNVSEAYPSGIFVEYHFDGFDPKYGGADWRSLRLVFENKDGIWYLVGVVHDQWTI